VVKVLKRIAKRTVIHAAARVAPITWKWRRPGSLVVLMYHRVLPKNSPACKTEQPGMYVSPETLDLHLTELKRRFELVHLDEWLRRAREDLPLPKLACAITFDDGWRDNYEFALPVLVKHEAPATIFLVSSYVGTAQQFWPNRLTELVLRESSQPGSVRFPEKLRMLVEPVLRSANRGKKLDIENADFIVQCALKFKEDEIRSLVDATEESGRLDTSRRVTLNTEEVAAMFATGFIRFGSHSATHFRLDSSASQERLTLEVVQSKVQLQQICPQTIDLFCYPNGVTCSSAISMVSSHYLGAVITETGWHSRGRNPYLIPRIRVHEDISSDRESFVERLSGWL
jgi:peptidoglycan/xylan/chitin deacetylase (PgdA/CDA1 family)